MSDLPPLTEDDFPPFFRAVHGYDPFPWQRRLVKDVLRDGWPGVLDLPTGSGKTAALDVALFTLASNIGATPRTAPLRIVYVVDRRTIVDQAFERAETIRGALRESTDEIVGRVRQRLAARTYDEVPLRTALLRGGIARDDAWARTPDQPLIAVSTVDQVGSRLLFRGYGLTDSMRPVHAGLLGCDVLYLLDEVHLSQPFKETLTAIRDRYRHWAERPLQAPFVVVEMSATPGEVTPRAFSLNEEDRRHPVLATRLKAPKPAVLASVNAKRFLHDVEQHALTMFDRPGATVAVVVNRVGTARELYDSLRERAADGTAVHLLTGRMRPFDRDTIERDLRKRIGGGRERRPDDPPVLVVATQAIEAGADFDFDALVTECASLDALRQRFGRLDRLGHLTGSARGVVVARTDAFKDDPVYGDAIGKTWAWLTGQAKNQIIDFGIEKLSIPPDAPEQGLFSPKAHAPILLPSHLDAWVQTAPLPEPDPDVALWLHGPERGLADVQIVWRADLTLELLERAAADTRADAERAKDVAIGRVDAMPPLAAEAMAVPFLAARRWLAERPDERREPEFSDVEGGRITDDDQPTSWRPVLVWRGEQSKVIAGDQVRPGHTIVVPASYGGIGKHDNWAPASETPVSDLAEIARMRQRRRPMLRLHPAVVSSLFGTAVSAPVPLEDADGQHDREAVIEWLEGVDLSDRNVDIVALVEHLRRYKKALRVERLPLGPDNESGEYFHLTGRRLVAVVDDGADEPTTDDPRSSFTGVAVTLSDHLFGVGETAAFFAACLDLPKELIADLQLAGEWHDSGKADFRFQRWLHGGSEFKALVQPEPLAKAATKVVDRAAMTRARERAGYPSGGRHELVSVALMRAAHGCLSAGVHDWALVQHLVASHHGYCRPFAPYVTDDAPADVVFARDGITCRASSAHRLERLDSGIADTFWSVVRQYGWWGLALLEACLRLADHRQSEREQVARERRGE